MIRAILVLAVLAVTGVKTQRYESEIEEAGREILGLRLQAKSLQEQNERYAGEIENVETMKQELEGLKTKTEEDLARIETLTGQIEVLNRELEDAMRRIEGLNHEMDGAGIRENSVNAEASGQESGPEMSLAEN